MKVVYLITGSGSEFYCANCYRDMLYLRAIKKVPGISARAVPLYLPPDKSLRDPGFEKEVFFGAISMFLRDKVKVLRNMSPFWDKILDSPPLLKLASKMSGSTNTDGLEDMTLNMISGDNSFQEHEVERLLRFISKDGAPDIIHLSNALIMGLGKLIKQKNSDINIVCSLLNEDDWIEDMKEPYRSKAWELMGEQAGCIDRFITPSNYYKELFVGKTGADPEKVDVVPIGFDPEPVEWPEKPSNNPSIGFFSRMNDYNGFDKMVDAFILLKESGRFPDLKLLACGGFTGEDKPFVSKQKKKIKQRGLDNYFELFDEFTGNGKIDFLKSVDIISVPVSKYDGYGLYILEANSAGIPVVMPHTGAFPEIIAHTGGGITYSPDTVGELAKNLAALINDKEKIHDLGAKGKKGVAENLSMRRMSVGISDVYNKSRKTT
ncbi:MAG: glycosyltransferase family 4 protein [Bacteroidales bacterium]|jgi:glycosyltransferase involved in cell wall biosynthesis